MQLDAMLGKSSVGWENKVPETSEISLDAARRNLLRFDEVSRGMLQREHKPYCIPGASLLSRTKASSNKK